MNVVGLVLLVIIVAVAETVELHGRPHRLFEVRRAPAA